MFEDKCNELRDEFNKARDEIERLKNALEDMVPRAELNAARKVRTKPRLKSILACACMCVIRTELNAARKVRNKHRLSPYR